MNRYKQYLILIFVASIWGWFAVINVQAQDSTVNGTVTDRSANPISGAKITLEEEPNVQTYTDANGKFAIPAQLGQRLEISLSGKTSKVVTIGEESMYITLENSKRIQLESGAVQSTEGLMDANTTVNASSLISGSSINAGTVLYGSVPGLMALDSGGFPPSTMDLFVRGQRTLNDSSPLVLIDGFERPFLSYSNLGGLTIGEIQNITLIKNAAALARYGQRGANGVLLITTKRGHTDGLEVTASLKTGITQPTKLPAFVEAPTYARAVNEALLNDGRSTRYGFAALEAYDEGTIPELYPNVDWFDQVLRDNGIRSNFDLSFQGGGENARYFTHLNLVSDNGLFGPVNTNPNYNAQLKYSRFNFRSNLDIDITDKLLLNIDVTGNLTERQAPGGGGGANQIFDALYRVPSGAFPVKTPDGSWGGTQIYDNNPMALLTDRGFGQPNSRQYSLTGRLKRDLSYWLEGLSAEASISYLSWGSFFEKKTKSYSYQALLPVRDQSGNIVGATATDLGQDTDLDFSDSFGNKRHFTDIVGRVNYETVLSENNILQASVQVDQSARAFNGQDQTYHRRNFVGTAHLDLEGKYLFDVVASYSGNNHLPEGNRYTFFPAVSASWVVSEESFFQGGSFVDHLKLRASLGKSGSDILPTDNPYEQSYHQGNGYHYQNSNNAQNGFAEGRLATSDFTVESSYQTDFGISTGLFGKLDLSADLFYARRTNILIGTSGDISDVIGIQKPLETDGIVDNRGIEVMLDWQDNIGDVGYRLGGQFAFARSEIVEMNEQFRPHEYLRRTGKSVGQIFGLEATGFFEDQDDIENSPEQLFSEVSPGDIKYKDQNGDGIINEFDEVPLGHASTHPEIYFSATLGLNYKGFDISALFQGTGNYSAYLTTPSVYWPLRNNTTISTHYFNNRWTPETSESAKYPRLTTEDNANNFRPNSIWVKDRSFIKLRSVEVSYSLPLSITEQMNMKKVRVFGKGMNLFSIDNIEMLDPEHLSTEYPNLRSYSLGLEVSF